MGLVSVKINIADREYTIKVEEQDEPLVRSASELLNRQVREQKEKMKISDRQDLLSFVAFDCIYEKLAGEKLLAQVSQKMTVIEDLVNNAV
ncbi:MAG: cell division protein ZapA [Cytophagales bacterium]|nr:MAG: cell division protein ZapA [Cytophagales bacterium]